MALVVGLILLNTRDGSEVQRQRLLRLADAWHTAVFGLALVLLLFYGAGVAAGIGPLFADLTR